MLIYLSLLLAGCTNEPPSPPLVSIEPASPYTTDDLTAVVVSDALDLEDDELVYRYQWLRGGVPQVEEQVLASSYTTKDQHWAVDVWAWDGQTEGPATRVEVTILNSPPTATVQLQPERPRAEDDTLCVGTGQDADMDLVAFDYRWFVDGEAVAVGELISQTAYERGDQLQCEATPHDGSEAGEPVLSAPVIVGNTPPVVTSLAMNPELPTRGQDVTAVVEGEDFEGDPITWTYRWTADGTEVGTGATLSGSTFSRGQVLALEATPSDGLEEGEPGRVEVTVGDARPVVTDLALCPDPAYTDDVLELCTVETLDPDGDAVELSLRWWVDDEVVPEGSSTTLDGATWFSRDQVVVIEAVPYDGARDGEPVTASTTIANSPPSITGASLSATEVYEGTTLQCEGEGWSDADDDGEGYDTTWYVDGVAISSRTVDGSDFDRDDTVWCELVPDDGTDTGSSATSDTVLVLNSPPNPPFLDLEPEDETSTSQDLSCTVDLDSTDDDGDSVSYNWSWTLDGVTTSHTGEEVDDDDTTAGTWTCTVTPADGYGDGYTSDESVEVYDQDGDLDVSHSASILLGDDSGDKAGTSLAVADLDGDGQPDLITGTPYEDCGGTDAGGLVISWGPLAEGSSDLLDDGEEWCGPYAGDLAGWSLDAGDVDGDGDEDLLVGSPYHKDTSSSQGAVWLLDGPITTSGDVGDDALAWVMGAYASDTLGWAVAVGEVSDDSYADLLAAAPGHHSSRGRVYLFEGPVSGELDLDDASATVSGSSSSDQAGKAILAGRDLDGDGTGDVVVGVTGEDLYASDAGAVVIFEGPLSGTLGLTDTDALLLGGTSGDRAGQQLAWGGDTDGDGYEDLLVGAPYEDTGASDAGAAYLVLGGSLPSMSYLGAADAVITGITASDQAAVALGPGDLDGDGYDDVVVGAPYEDTTDSSAGAVYTLLGPVSGSVSLSDADGVRRGEASGDQLGQVLAAGELTGDAFPDLALAAPLSNSGTRTQAPSSFGEVDHEDRTAAARLPGRL